MRSSPLAALIGPLTLALAGCASSRSAGPDVVHFQPLPGAQAPSSQGEPVGVAKAATPPASLAVASGAGRLVRRADGSCIEQLTTQCAPNEACDPPAPVRVRCPEGN